jgi:hypothetical protein
MKTMKFNCPRCQQHIEAPSTFAGRKTLVHQ